MSAPASARNVTTLGRCLYAAPCMTVSPLSSTSFRSPPSSSATFTASSTSGSVPGSSPGDDVPTPAATMIGVVLSSFGSSGSAPSSASSRIRPASPVRAASRNGVPPRKLSRVIPAGGRLVTRALTSAPAATILRTNSRLVMLPEPLGDGLLLPAMPALRTQDTWWSAVQPREATLTSAPLSTSSAASS